jgi:hypothetical protein
MDMVEFDSGHDEVTPDAETNTCPRRREILQIGEYKHVY